MKIATTEYFEQAYSRILEARRLYDAAKAASDENGMAEARTIVDDVFEDVRLRGDTYWFVWHAYKNSMDHENGILDISDWHSWDDEKALIACLKETGIRKFTFSSTWSGSFDTAWGLQQAGCKLEGLVEINGMPETWGDDVEYEKRHALLFSL